MFTATQTEHSCESEHIDVVDELMTDLQDTREINIKLDEDPDVASEDTDSTWDGDNMDSENEEGGDDTVNGGIDTQ